MRKSAIFLANYWKLWNKKYKKMAAHNERFGASGGHSSGTPKRKFEK